MALLIGIFIGFLLGMMVMALCAGSKIDDLLFENEQLRKMVRKCKDIPQTNHLN